MRVVKNVLGIFLAVIAVILLVCLVLDKGYGLKHFSISAVAENTAVNAENSLSGSMADSPDKASGLKCEAAIAVDMGSGQTLYAKNIHEKLYPASLTKLMTALLLSEHDSKNDLLTYTEKDKSEPSNKMDFPVGSKLTADNAMKALLIFSANDIATMVGENVSGSVSDFAALMNKKAKSLGMNDTHFTNANGLPDSNHYTSAYDISILARQAYKVSWIANTMETPSALVKTNSGKSMTIYNTNQILGKNGCFAGKTGNTTAAGWCLAAFYHRDGHTILGVVMKSQNEDELYADMGKLIALSEQKN